MADYRPQIARDLQWDEVKDFHRYAKFPSTPYGRMNAVTSSLNNGVKALMLSRGLSEERWSTSKQIKECVENAIGGKYVVGESTFLYCAEKMGLVGLVEKAKVRKKRQWRNAYSLTEEGELLRPIVDHSIRVFVDNKLDFHEVFGTAHSGAPITRVNILRKLYERGELTEKYIADHLSLSLTAVQHHAEALKSIGLIEFKSMSACEGKKLPERPLNFGCGNSQALLSSNDKTAKFFEDWIFPVSKALEGDFSMISTELDKKYLTYVADRFVETSSIVNRHRPEIMLSEIGAIVNARPGVKIREILEELPVGLNQAQRLVALAERKRIIDSIPLDTSASMKRLYPFQQD